MISKTIDGETTTYQYDYDNRLIQVTKPDGAVIIYKYDPFSRRIEKDINGTTTKYIYNSSQIIQETDNANVVKAAYVYGLGIDEPLIMQRSGATYYYHLDGLGSVTDITDSSGNMVEKYKYGPFGEPLIIDPETGIVRESTIVSNPYLFTGREYDGEIDLYYYRARHYSYRTGCFLQSDPMGYIDGANTYIYSKNNPINFVDASGTTVKVCYTDIVSLLHIRHRYVLVKSRKSKFNGSWGFDYFPKNQKTLEKVLAGEVVQGQIRENEHDYQRPNKPKCKTVVTGTNYDYCIYKAVKRRLSAPPPLYELRPGYSGRSGTDNCLTWSRKLLWECGIYFWDTDDSIYGGSTFAYSNNSVGDDSSGSDISK